MEKTPSKNDISLRAIFWAWRTRVARSARHQSSVSSDAVFGFLFNVSVSVFVFPAVIGAATAVAFSLLWASASIPISEGPWIYIWFAASAATAALVIRWGLLSERAGVSGLTGAYLALETFVSKMIDRSFSAPVSEWKVSDKSALAAVKLIARPCGCAMATLALGFGVAAAICAFFVLALRPMARSVRQIGPATQAAKARALAAARDWTSEGRSGKEFACDERRQMDEAASAVTESGKRSAPTPRL